MVVGLSFSSNLLNNSHAGFRYYDAVYNEIYMSVGKLHYKVWVSKKIHFNTEKTLAPQIFGYFLLDIF
jgi:hypothetical protein